jgi:dihydrofolate reductase
MIEIVLLVAVAENGVIGSAGSIPWRLKTDQQRLKTMTMGKPVVMGRKTNIVITRDANFRAAGAVVTTSFADARATALGDALRRLATEIAVIGGAEIYAQWMDVADRLEVTEVHAKPEGDTRLAPVDPKEWKEVARTSHVRTDDDTADFSYVTYTRHSRSLRPV